MTIVTGCFSHGVEVLYGVGLKCMLLSVCQFWFPVVPVFFIGVLELKLRKLYSDLTVTLVVLACFSQFLASSFSFA